MWVLKIVRKVCTSRADEGKLSLRACFRPLAFAALVARSRGLQSFQFLVDVEEFKDLIADSAGEENEKSFGGFGGYLAIVNDYIKDGSHSEVNIASTTKRSIMQYMKFTAYAALQLVRGGRETLEVKVKLVGVGCAPPARWLNTHKGGSSCSCAFK